MSRKNWSSEKIFDRLLNNKTQKTYWDNISELRKRPSQSVFEKAFSLAKSNIDKEKIIGLNVLQQLGFDPRYNKKQMLDLHFELLDQKQSNKVLVAIFSGIGHNNDELSERQILKLTSFKNIQDGAVKFAMVSAFTGLEHSKAINTLIEFSKVDDPGIRNWSTFGIGTQIQSDSEAIRNALWDRVDDSDFETKNEAIFGLAKRKDKRVKSVILKELETGEFGTLLLEAIVELMDTDFLPLLKLNYEASKTEEDLSEFWIALLKETIEKLEKLA